MRKRVPFAPSPHDVVDRMLSIADPKPDELLVDLGSGDGRIVISASHNYRCRAIGVEINPKLLNLSREKITRMGLNRAQIIPGDIYSFDFLDANIVTLYLLPEALMRLKPKLMKLKRGTRVISHGYLIPGLKPDETHIITSTFTGRRHKIYLYKVK